MYDSSNALGTRVIESALTEATSAAPLFHIQYPFIRLSEERQYQSINTTQWPSIGINCINHWVIVPPPP